MHIRKLNQDVKILWKSDPKNLIQRNVKLQPQDVPINSSSYAPSVYYFAIDFSSVFMYFLRMKIERISDNQIKFTLNRTDLASHQLKVSELAYVTDKTRDLLMDMMEQASDELGFEFNDMPVMIETIPVSMDCIILMITKVDQPDEVDTKFSNFTTMKDLLADDTDEAEPELPPFLPSKIRKGIKEARKSSLTFTERMFSFASLEDVIDFSHQSDPFFNGNSSLYRSPDNGRYYLILENNADDIKAFGRVCNCALEYGSKEPFGFARGAYIDEHFSCIIKKDALRSLANV